MTSTPARSYAPEIIVAAGCLIALITFGPRASAGLFDVSHMGPAILEGWPVPKHSDDKTIACLLREADFDE